MSLKKFTKSFLPFECIPKQKILKLHRSKWKNVQKLVLKRISYWKKKKITIKSQSVIPCSTRRWQRRRFIFSFRLVLKKIIQNLFFNAVTNKQLAYLSTSLKKHRLTDCVKNYLFKLEFRLDILLCRLYFFESCLTVTKEVQIKNITQNNHEINVIQNLVKGDIIRIKKVNKLIFINKRFRSAPHFFHSYIEVDFYTQTLIIVKDLKELSTKDFFLLSKYMFSVLHLQDYLLK